ncbi:heme-responsive zinc finger transcription factor HAP1 [Striga asiatica]|uniref:Heme-responsive zinc finger transcription factor HAP1 n=1 Tax=Striga asiatica TaxID=4170 RepID=A0A5A7PU68_STRAF|nr:heme-responsive zinc finger transcription factor HAP1 [Striga asiatica]
MMLNWLLLVSSGRSVGLAAPVHAARMLTPGPVTSGLRISGVTEFGPLELNAATTGAGFTFTIVPPKLSTAVAFLCVVRYSFIASPDICPTATAGRKWLSATSSSPFSSVLASIIPKPPAAFTAAPFCTRAFSPLSHNTTLPFTWARSRDPHRHRLLDSLPLGLDVSREIPVDCAGADGRNPRRDVRDRTLAWAGVSGRARDEDPLFHGRKSSDGDDILVVRHGLTTEGHGKDVDSVFNRTVNAREYPKRLTLGTTAPAAVLAVCVPWPSRSRADIDSLVLPTALLYPSVKDRAPISFRLQKPFSHVPPHREGTFGMPSSLKDFDSGQTPSLQSVAGLLPGQPQKLRRARGVELVHHVLVHLEDGVRLAQGIGLLWGEGGSEAMERVLVGVDDVFRFSGGEGVGHEVFIHVYDVEFIGGRLKDTGLKEKGGCEEPDGRPE